MGEFADQVVTTPRDTGLRHTDDSVALPWLAGVKFLRDRTLLVLELAGGGFVDFYVSGVTAMDDNSVEVMVTGAVRSEWEV